MRRKLAFALAVIIAVLISAFAVSAQDKGQKAQKDGIVLELSEPVYPSEGGLPVWELSLTDGSEYCDSFRITFRSDSKYLFNLSDASGPLPDPGNYSLSPGDGQTSVLKLSLSEPLDDASVETSSSSGDDGSGCRSAGPLPLIFLAAFVASVWFFKVGRKGKKSSAALILAFCLLSSAALSLVPLTASASNTDRYFEMESSFSADGREIPFTVRIDYVYGFSESAAEGTTGMEKFEITYYWGPHREQATDESFYIAIAEAGFTSIPLEINTYENNIKALELMRKHGLTCSALYDSRVDNCVNTLNDSVTDAALDAALKEVVDSYKDYADVIKGWWLRDEPSADFFPVLGRVVASFRRVDPGRSTMINLFPTYAKESTQLRAKSYKDYLSKFIEQVDPHYLSYDHYHFQTSGPRNGFYTNIEAIREAGLASGRDQMSIILLTKHGNYADVTVEQLSWEVNISLAYGMKRISYFTFILDPDLLAQNWSNACMLYTGEKCPHYYMVSGINQWLLPLGNELFGKTSTAVFHIGTASETGTQRYTSYGDLGSVEGTGYVVGFFDDESFLIVNKATISGGTKELLLNDIRSGLEWFDTSSASWKSADDCESIRKSDDGRYAITTSSGGSILLRVAH
ncbi:MAG: hypothetical protein J5592_00170 [Clostridia bacterium]|nr:hypothetical protein [Clostridia bacterium]